MKGRVALVLALVATACLVGHVLVGQGTAALDQTYTYTTTMPAQVPAPLSVILPEGAWLPPQLLFPARLELLNLTTRASQVVVSRARKGLEPAAPHH